MNEPRRPWLRFALIGVVVLTPLISFSVWQLKPSLDLRVQVLDKTVPHRDYREHGALFWLLRHDKIRSTAEHISWPVAEEYVGFRPGPENSPESGDGSDLQEADLENADLLYIADTYGVYSEDYDIWEPGRTHLDFSRKIYGGMTAAEMTAVEAFADRGGSVVAEFNTFASPTPGSVRRRAEELLGLDWTGWSGRHFHDLSDVAEVPVWARREWKNQRGTPWSFEGPGYLLVHENSTVIVLRTGTDIRRGGLRLVVERKSSPLMAGVVDGTVFSYWFDIVQPHADSEVLGRFEFQLEPSGEQIVREAGIPSAFPAVVRGSGAPLRIYMAGDFSDSALETGVHFFEGLPWLHRLGARAVRSGPVAFYWGVYTPFLHNVMREAADIAARRGDASGPQVASR